MNMKLLLFVIFFIGIIPYLLDLNNSECKRVNTVLSVLFDMGLTYRKKIVTDNKITPELKTAFMDCTVFYLSHEKNKYCDNEINNILNSYPDNDRNNLKLLYMGIVDIRNKYLYMEKKYKKCYQERMNQLFIDSK